LKILDYFLNEVNRGALILIV